MAFARGCIGGQLISCGDNYHDLHGLLEHFRSEEVGDVLLILREASEEDEPRRAAESARLDALCHEWLENEGRD